jgi:hypothetical protein
MFALNNKSKKQKMTYVIFCFLITIILIIDLLKNDLDYHSATEPSSYRHIGFFHS